VIQAAKKEAEAARKKQEMGSQEKKGSSAARFRLYPAMQWPTMAGGGC
jgi:hypothetical protein